MRPNNASVVWDVNGYDWSDKIWMENREKTQGKDKPMSIYEVHLGSWIRKPLEEDEDGDPVAGILQLPGTGSAPG